jgi:hypothetical protein
MRRFFGFLLFLVFVEELGAPYTTQLASPFVWVHYLLFEPSPIVLRPFDLILLVILAVGLSKHDRKHAFVAPMRNGLLLMFATTILWFLYGLARGGDFRYASWQTYLILSTVLLAFAVAVTFRTAREFQGLANWLIAAATYRAFMCWLSYFTWARNHIGESGMFLTSHDDTISWVVSILILIVNTFDRRSAKITIRNVAFMLFFLGAIQFNSRRLAWVSLAMGLVVMYVLIPRGAVKRKINRIALIVAPLVVVYVAVGWGSPNTIFLPLKSLSTVSTQEDASTLARNAENLGLIATANSVKFALGTGWGWPYIALTRKYDISGAFDLWQYIPHNSILGLLAFTGTLGFAGFWLALPTAVFLNARVALLSTDSKARSVAIIGAAQLVVCVNQLYGDMGVFFLKPMYTIAVAYAIALHLPRNGGDWVVSRANALPQKP